MSNRFARLALGALLLTAMLGAPSSLAQAAQPAGPGGPSGPPDRLIVVARDDAHFDRLRETAQRAGATIVGDLDDLRDGGMLVVRATPAARAQIESSGLTQAVAEDHVEKLVPNPAAQLEMFNRAGAERTKTQVKPSAALRAARPRPPAPEDPAFGLPGLMWSIERIHAPQAWDITQGSPNVRVGVADTGIDFTHAELAPRVADVIDFTGKENPPLCSTFLPNPFTGTLPGIGDADLARMFGGPATTDWNGHGTWVAGNIAAALDGQGVNGIAPNVKLVSLKIAQWCGNAYDSVMMDAFLYASKHNIDVINISIGGYLDLRDHAQAAIWARFNRVVERVRNRGTLIASAAGNESVRVGPAGLVISHGTLTVPGAPVIDQFGTFSVPGGLPGVIDVSATANVVVPSSASCPDDTAVGPFATCKPLSDRHQAGGQGTENQLAYYSNYGPRIDIAGPGGARKFNLPGIDRGGTPGFPYTDADGFTDYAAFSTTSNWGIVVPCFVIPVSGFAQDQCYSPLQGTSMSAPHVSAVLALIASNEPGARGNPDRLTRILKNSARDIHGNQTRMLSRTDTSPGDQSGGPCTTGYCHLSGREISDNEAYGVGLVDARRALNR